MGEAKNAPLRVGFDRKLKHEFHGAKGASDAGLLLYRELNGALGLTAIPRETLDDPCPGNVVLSMVLLKTIAHRRLTTLREKLIKIGAKVVGVGRDVRFQMAEVAKSGRMFDQIPRNIGLLKAPQAWP